jgi:hypothetical protein
MTARAAYLTGRRDAPYGQSTLSTTACRSPLALDLANASLDPARGAVRGAADVTLLLGRDTLRGAELVVGHPTLGLLQLAFDLVGHSAHGAFLLEVASVIRTLNASRVCIERAGARRRGHRRLTAMRADQRRFPTSDARRRGVVDVALALVVA